MPNKVTLPDGRVVNFPDTMTAPEIQAAMRQLAPAKDWSERLGLHEPTSSRALGFVRGAGTAAVDMAEGVASGAASTIFGGGDLIRRGVNAVMGDRTPTLSELVTGQRRPFMERVIDRPEVQSAMRAPETFAGQAGRFIEQGAEFAVPLTKLSKATKGASLFRRVATDAAASAGVAGVQTAGDTDAMTGAAVLGAGLPVVAAGGRAAFNAARRGAAGAAEGGLGGAIAGVVREAAPISPAATMIQALKPGTNNTGFTAALGRALPEIKASEAEIGTPIANLESFNAAIAHAKKRVRASYDAIAGPKRAMGSTVDLTPVAEAMEASIPSKAKLEDPRAVVSILDRADKYRRSFGLEEAEQLLKETNAELDAFYDKNPMAKRVAAAANPETAQLVAQGKALRDAIYRTLDDESQSQAARELNRRYGALMDVEQTALKRFNVARRQQPESLAEQIGKTRAAGELARGAWRLAHGDLTGAADIASARAGRATATFLKEQQTSDALVRRAMAAFKGLPEPVQMPTPPRIAGLLERGSLVTPPPADPSFVRGVPAMPSHSERLALPAPSRPLSAGADASGGGGVPARSIVVRDPRTGRMRRVYLGEEKR